MLVQSKPWWQSKTVWFNVLATVAAVLTAMLGLDWVKDNPALTSTIVAIMSFINTALRFITTKPVTVNGERVMIKP